MAVRQIKVSPVVNQDQHADNDVLFNCIPIELPIKGACKLLGIQVVDRAENATTDGSMQITFWNEDITLGTLNATAGTVTAMQARDSLLAYMTVRATAGTAPNDFDNFMVRDSRIAALSASTQQPVPAQPMVLQPKAGSRTIYMAGIVGPDSDTPTFTGSTGVIVNGAVSAGASTNVSVDTVDATLHFKVGDTVVDVDDNVIGVIESVTATRIVFTAVTAHALADDEELFTPHSLSFKVDIEY
tara:strand:- start:558 stop:1286 length:729 start_codon:yes stop_codon:yes gene_type:complete